MKNYSLTAGQVANVVNGLEPDAHIWIKVRKPNGRYKAYRASLVEPFDDGMNSKWCYAIVAEEP